MKTFRNHFLLFALCLPLAGQAQELNDSARIAEPAAGHGAEAVGVQPSAAAAVQHAATAVTPQQRSPFVGYLSYRAVYELLPEYAQAQADFAELKAKYEAEATRSEQEFQRKFAEFLSGQKDFPPSIMRKRQLELQDLMEQSISFREQSRKLLADAERQMQQVVCQRLDAAIRKVGERMGLLFVLNTDDHALPFVHPLASVDVTAEVKKELKIDN